VRDGILDPVEQLELRWVGAEIGLAPQSLVPTVHGEAADPIEEIGERHRAGQIRFDALFELGLGRASDDVRAFDLAPESAGVILGPGNPSHHLEEGARVAVSRTGVRTRHGSLEAVGRPGLT